MNQLNTELPNIAMQVILGASDAKGLLDSAMTAMADFQFDRASDLLDEADQYLLGSHRAQASVIQRQASGEDVEYSLLFIHAQDTFMTINAELHFARRALPVFQALAAATQATK